MVSTDVLLDTWERGRHAGAAARALHLLSIALPGADRETLARFEAGLRDWHLLRLRLAWFGRVVSGQTGCPACGEPLDISFDAASIASDQPSDPPHYTASNGRRFRLASIGDLAAIGDAADPDAAAIALFQRCSVDEATDNHIDELDDLFGEVDAGLAAIASARALHVDVSCALCGHRSMHALDPGEFLWTEICAAAAVLIDDVHRLARAYGWLERDILAMSPTRRAAYLRRVE